MAYKIRYDTTKPHKHPKLLRMQTIIAAMLLAFILFAHTFWEQGSSVIRKYLLPEDGKAVTAAETLVTQLENGVPFTDALNVFCESIINGE